MSDERGAAGAGPIDCPLCGGPLHLEQELFTCQVSHRFNGEELRLAAAHRTTIALWMAVSALEDQAEALHVLAGTSGDAEVRHAAEQADEDVRILRRIAEVGRSDVSATRPEPQIGDHRLP